MTELENVVKGLECCLTASMGEPICPTCTYRYDENGVETGDCEINLLKDAIALLKAQEPIVPIRCSAHAHGSDDVWYECGKCGEFLGVNRYSKQFCAKCGRPVKWND